MENQATGELSLLDVIKILWKKVKLILIIFLASIVVGGGIGAVMAIGQDYYGTEIQFYINPSQKEDGSSSDSDSNYGVYGSYGDNVMETMIKLLESHLFTEQLIEGWERTPVKYAEDGSINPAYKRFIYALEDVISYEYATTENAAVVSNNLAKSFIIIKIEIRANNQELVSFAQELLGRLRKVVPEYVTAHMIVPSGFVGTNCKEITTISEIEHLNEGYALTNAIKYAIILGAATLIVTCVLLVIIDRFKADEKAKKQAQETKEE